MDAPTEWTYGGLIDWSSPAKLKLLPVQLPLRCVIEALKERFEVSVCINHGHTIPSILEASYNPLQPFKDYADAIQSTISDLFQVWYSGGPPYYSYLDADAPCAKTGPQYLTEQHALVKIGADSRIQPPAKLDFCADWLFQQYKILNCMKVAYKLSGFSWINPQARSAGFDEACPPGGASTAAAAWSSAYSMCAGRSFAPGGSGPALRKYVAFNPNVEPIKWFGLIEHWKATLRIAYNAPGSRKYHATLYTSGWANDCGGDFPFEDIFGLGITSSGEWGKLFEWSSQQYQNPMDFGIDTPLTSQGPGGVLSSNVWYTVMASRGSGPYGVTALKFDTPGGFKFVA